MAACFNQCLRCFKNSLIHHAGIRRIGTFHTLVLLQKAENTSSSSESSESNSNHTSFNESEDEIRQKILSASLEYVHQHGWSFKALAEGAETVGLPSIAHGMFPDEGIELVHYFYKLCNDELVEKMEISENEMKSKDKNENIFIRNAIETRLRMVIPYIDSWPEAMALMALPQNATESWKNLAQLVDNIWFYAGDKSTDLNWYSKRFSLALVYKSSEFCLLQDKSDDFEETWGFLDRRISDFKNFRSATHQFQNNFSKFYNTSSGLLITVQNMLGLNNRIR